MSRTNDINAADLTKMAVVGFVMRVMIGAVGAFVRAW